MDDIYLTHEEYLVLKKISAREDVRLYEFDEKEREIICDLFSRGMLDIVSDEHREEKFDDGEAMLDKNTAHETNGAEKNAEPELNPRAGSVFTPTRIRGLFIRSALFFLAGNFFGYLIKVILVAD